MKESRRAAAVVLPLGIMILLLMIALLAGMKEAEDSALSIAERFQQATALPGKGNPADLRPQKPPNPPQYKQYAEAKMIRLLRPQYRGLPVEAAIEQRRSVREFSTRAIDFAQLSQLVFAAQGTTGEKYNHPLRAAPSAGALYPMELYVVVNRVEEIPQGIYHYNIRENGLELLEAGDFSARIIEAGLHQSMLGKSCVTFALSAVFDRTRFKYGERGMRYIYMEAGHISENIFLQAISLGLGSVSVGAFYDDKVNLLFGLDGQKESAIYLHAVGTL